MASIRKRGDTFTITAYMGYDEQGKQRKKTTTYRPPENVTPGKAEKLAKAFAANWEEKIRGYVALDENRTFAELAEWYYSTVAPSVLKPKTLIGYQKTINDHVMPFLGREKLKNITPPMLDSLFAELQRSGNMQSHFALRDKSIFDGMKHIDFIEAAGIERSIFYKVLRGDTVERKNAEKIAAGLKKPLEKVFEDKTEKRGLSGSSISASRIAFRVWAWS